MIEEMAKGHNLDESLSLLFKESDSDILVDNVPVDRGVILYGSGELGRLALSYCRKSNIRVILFLDQSCVLGEASELSTLSIYNPNHQFPLEYYSLPVVVCVASYPFESIKDSLLSIGWKFVFPFYQLTRDGNSFYPISNGWLIGKFSQKEKSKIEYVFEHLEDDCSRDHYKSFLCWHLAYREQQNPRFPINTRNRYYVEPIEMFLRSKAHTVIDAGAHRGQLLDILLDHEIAVMGYHAFEPDPQTYEILKHKLTLSTIPNSVTQECISSRTSSAEKFFAGLNYCSKLSQYGGSSIKTVSIDSLDLKPTIIKYHTEGAELEGLKGSKNTIIKYHPLIMASLYHNRDGLCNTLYYLITTHNNYRCYLRLHSYQGTGLFLYALPVKP